MGSLPREHPVALTPADLSVPALSSPPLCPAGLSLGAVPDHGASTDGTPRSGCCTGAV